MFILPSHGVVDFTCMAWNSLFKCIKIQRMQVFWREDEPDYLLRVLKIYLSRNSDFLFLPQTRNSVMRSTWRVVLSF